MSESCAQQASSAGRPEAGGRTTTDAEAQPAKPAQRSSSGAAAASSSEAATASNRTASGEESGGGGGKAGKGTLVASLPAELLKSTSGNPRRNAAMPRCIHNAAQGINRDCSASQLLVSSTAPTVNHKELFELVCVHGFPQTKTTLAAFMVPLAEGIGVE